MSSQADGRNGSRSANPFDPPLAKRETGGLDQPGTTSGAAFSGARHLVGRMQLALEAAAFAEAGDCSGATRLLRENRRVLLALRGLEGDARTMTYARNTCQRIGAGLDVLCVADRALPEEELGRALAPFLASLAAAGIPCRTFPIAGCIKEQIIRYTRAHPEVSFVVVESAGVLDRGCGIDDERRLARLWNRLTCPLVVVSDPARAMAGC